MDKPILSIVIVKYCSDDFLQQCIDSIKPDKQWEIIVVDNDKENVGYGAGCNKGAKNASGKYLFFLNPDTVVLEGAIETMIDYMVKNRDVAVLGPKIYKNVEKEKQLSFCRFPDPITSFFVFSPIKSFWPGNPFFSRYVYHEDKKDNDILNVGAVAGAAILVRKEVFEKVGGFDENFFLYFEENDLCRRIKKDGGRIVYFPEAEVIHFGGKSTIDIEKSSKIFKKSRFYFFKKHYGIFIASIIEGKIIILETIARIK